jgi:predicted CDP-diglyceride synthetase/phosphatidate cytidylyltransferase
LNIEKLPKAEQKKFKEITVSYDLKVSWWEIIMCITIALAIPILVVVISIAVIRARGDNSAPSSL